MKSFRYHSLTHTHSIYSVVCFHLKCNNRWKIEASRYLLTIFTTVNFVRLLCIDQFIVWHASSIFFLLTYGHHGRGALLLCKITFVEIKLCFVFLECGRSKQSYFGNTRCGRFCESIGHQSNCFKLREINQNVNSLFLADKLCKLLISIYSRWFGNHLFV